MNRMMQSAAIKIVALTVAAGTLTGCVGQGEYDNLYTTNRSLKARNAELERERDEARTALEALKKSLGAGEGALAALQKENSELRRLLDEANGSLKDLEAKMAGLDFGKLDADTDQQIRKLAEMYPDLIKYDAERGMLRFASDLTFDSGSVVVKEQAKRALAALAQVLKSDSASKYEVVIEGHTDSQRISANTRKDHPTNRHLSAHRAISVIDVLGNNGVGFSRMMAAGWGEFRPLVPNTGNGNTPANRRVEIYLAKGHSTGAASSEAPAPSKPAAKAAADRREPPAKPMDLTK
jgi:chemotaxis protein MotB